MTRTALAFFSTAVDLFLFKMAHFHISSPSFSRVLNLVLLCLWWHDLASNGGIDLIEEANNDGDPAGESDGADHEKGGGGFLKLSFTLCVDGILEITYDF